MKYLIFYSLLFLSFSGVHSQTPAETKVSIIKEYDRIEIENLELSSTDKLKMLCQQSRKLDFAPGVIRGLILLQRCALIQNDYILSGKYADEAEILAEDIGDYNALSKIYMYRGQINIIVNKHAEAKADLETAVGYCNKITNEADKHIQFCRIYANYAGMYEGLKDSDRWFESTKKSLNFIETTPLANLTEYQKSKYYYLYIFELMNMGAFYVHGLKNPDLVSAETYFQKVLEYQRTKPEYFKMFDIDVYYALSGLYLIKGDYQKAIDYGQKMLDTEKAKSSPRDRRFAYNNLKEAYGLMKNVTEENKYLRLYTALNDSINMVQNKTVVYQSREQVTNVLKKTLQEKQTVYLTSLGIVLAILAISIGFITIKSRQTHKKYEALISKLSNQEENIPTNEAVKNKETKPLPTITDDKSKVLLQKLEIFEKSDKYLRKDISVAWLAHHLETNTKYLSEGIKLHRDNNFSNYINRLKINYIINKLYTDPIYREYKINYLSEECGYATPRVFLNAFKKETGITPSYFIQGLQNEKVS